jgi:hypothetical protein
MSARLELDNHIFWLGDKVSGALIVNLDNPVNIRGVKAELKCKYSFCRS